MKASLRIAIAAALLSTLLVVGAVAQPSLADGQVTKIDTAAQKMTLRHGPLKKFDMEEPMTMVFRVKEPAMLSAVKVGDKVKFDAEKINGQFTVTKIEKAK